VTSGEKILVGTEAAGLAPERGEDTVEALEEWVGLGGWSARHNTLQGSLDHLRAFSCAQRIRADPSTPVFEARYGHGGLVAERDERFATQPAQHDLDLALRTPAHGEPGQAGASGGLGCVIRFIRFTHRIHGLAGLRCRIQENVWRYEGKRLKCLVRIKQLAAHPFS